MSTWYEKTVFYHMYPLGMTGAPKENRSEAGSCRFGQLEEWIPHIASLGCGAIYIGPLFESTSHGYDTRDYRLVDRRLGSNEDFRRFVQKCHQAGIRVVVDGVFNHTGREFFAFQDIQQNGADSACKDWYKGVSFHQQSPCGDAFCYECWQGHWPLPVLNLQNPQVKEFLFDCVKFWIDEFAIDGIRLDCANVLDFTFMRELRHLTDGLKADFWLMGEVIHGDYARWIHDAGLHSVTNYELHKSLYSGFNDHNFFEIAHNVLRLKEIHQQLYTFVDNHDENRIASKLHSKGHLPPVYACLYTLPGIPSLYYGSEWGMEGQRSSTSDDALRPAVAPSEFAARDNSLTDLLRDLGRIYQENAEYHTGTYEPLLLTNRQFAFARRLAGSMCITVLNNDENEAHIQVPVPLPASEVTALTGTERYPVNNGKLEITLPGNGFILLKATEG